MITPEPETDDGGTLTDREQGIAALIAEGLSNKAIAERLGLREKTVKNRVSDILSRLGVSNRTEAAMWFLRRSSTETQEKSAGKMEAK